MVKSLEKTWCNCNHEEDLFDECCYCDETFVFVNCLRTSVHELPIKLYLLSIQIQILLFVDLNRFRGAQDDDVLLCHRPPRWSEDENW